MANTYNDLLTQLRKRLNDQNDRFWPESEKLMLLWETLTIFNLVTGYWQVSSQFAFGNSVRVVDFTLPDALLPNHTPQANPFPLPLTRPTRLLNLDLIKHLTKLICQSTSEPELNPTLTNFNWATDAKLISGMYSDSEGPKQGEDEFGEGLSLLRVVSDVLADLQKSQRLTVNWYKGTNSSKQVDLWSDGESFGITSLEGLILFSEAKPNARYNKLLSRFGMTDGSVNQLRFYQQAVPCAVIDRGNRGTADKYEAELVQSDRPYLFPLYHFFGEFPKLESNFIAEQLALNNLQADLDNGVGNYYEPTSWDYGSKDWAKSIATRYSPLSNYQLPLAHYATLANLFSRGGFAMDGFKAQVVQQFVDFLSVVTKIAPVIMSNTPSVHKLFANGVGHSVNKLGFMRNCLTYLGELPQDNQSKIYQDVTFMGELPIPTAATDQAPTLTIYYTEQLLYLTEFLANIKLGGAELQGSLSKLEKFMAFAQSCLGDKQRTMSNWITDYSRFISGKLDKEGIDSYVQTMSLLMELDKQS